MDQETKEIISKQTGQDDLLIIEKTYFECECDVGETVLKLLNIAFLKKTKAIRTQFDEMREILDEKDTIYQEVIKKNNKSI
jgi:hypothetical protein